MRVPPDRATEIAKRIIPAAGSEWPLSQMGYAVVIGHAANIIKAEIATDRQLLVAALDDLILAVELPGDHCEVEQAVRVAKDVLSRYRPANRT